MVAGHDLGRRHGQPDPVRLDVAVRRRADGPVRHAGRRRQRALPDRRRQLPDAVHDPELAAHPVLGRASRTRRRIDGPRLRRHGHQPLVRQAQGPGDRHPHRGRRGRSARLPAAARLAGRQPLVAERVAHGQRGRAGGRPGGARPPAQPPAGRRGRGLRGRRARLPGATAGARPRRGAGRRVTNAPSARSGQPDPDVLAAGGHVRDLRGQHQRADRHPLHPGRPRSRDGQDGSRRAPRAGRHLRHRRHDPVGLAHRSSRLTDPAGRVLRRPWRVAAVPADAADRPRPAADALLHRVLRTRLGCHGAADGGALPPALRRGRIDRVRLGPRLAPDRRRCRRARRRRRSRQPRLV